MYKEKRLSLILFDDEIYGYLDTVKEALTLFKLHLGKIKSLKILKEAYNPFRGQYRAEALLRSLKEERVDDYLLALTKDDIYVEGLNFVFGLALPYQKLCIVSLNRLFSEDERLYRERIYKEIVHEIGHLFRLEHCNDRRCIMYFANSILDVDYRVRGLCKKCLVKLELLTL
ncbi:MAG: archaemetzincin family Zn-dependent metalloprotease [Nitrososphaerales archaeon]